MTYLILCVKHFHIGYFLNQELSNIQSGRARFGMRITIQKSRIYVDKLLTRRQVYHKTVYEINPCIYLKTKKPHTWIFNVEDGKIKYVNHSPYQLFSLMMYRMRTRRGIQLCYRQLDWILIFVYFQLITLPGCSLYLVNGSIEHRILHEPLVINLALCESNSFSNPGIYKKFMKYLQMYFCDFLPALLSTR